MVEVNTAQLWEPPLNVEPPITTWNHECGSCRVADDGTIYMLANDTLSYAGATAPGRIYEMDVYAGPDAPVSPNVGDAYKSIYLTLTGSRRAQAFDPGAGQFGMGGTISTMSAAAPDNADTNGTLIFDSGGLLADVSDEWRANQTGTNAARCVYHAGDTWYVANYRPDPGGTVISMTPGAAPGTSGTDNAEADLGVSDWTSDGTYIWAVGNTSPTQLLQRWDPVTDTVTSYNLPGLGTQAMFTIGYGLVCDEPRLLMMGNQNETRLCIVDPANPTGVTAYTLDPWPTGDCPLSLDYDPVWDRWIAAFDSNHDAERGVWQIRFVCCVPIAPEPLHIPFKDRLDTLARDFTEPAIDLAIDHQFDNFKVIERWAHEWMVLAESADRCDLFIPYKDHSRQPPETSAAQSFDNWKEIERWALSISDGDCGCNCPGAAEPPDRCRLHIPFKDHLLDVDMTDPDQLARAATHEFDNFLTLERWANRYASGECGCTV